MTAALPPLPLEDLELVLEHTAPLWERQRGSRLFITGGTGFFGHWLVESFCLANDRLKLGAHATLLTRDPKRFAARAPHVANHPAISLHRGDVKNFEFPVGEFDTLVHAAIDPSLKPELAEVMIPQNTAHVLNFALNHNVRQELFTSSGAVYGAQPANLAQIPETFSATGPRTPYGIGKSIAEGVCLNHAALCRKTVKIARCFAFAGPHLPLDANFAIGNFIGDALAGRDIVIQGDGRPLRSYLYGADLAIWLWTLLFKPSQHAVYNVGAEQAYHIGEVADHVIEVAARFGKRIGRKILGEPASGAPPRYIPSTRRALAELGLSPTVGLTDSIAKTFRWHGLQER